MGARTTVTADNGVPGPGHYDWKDQTGTHRLARSIHPHIEDPNARRIDVPFVNTRAFPSLAKKSIHPLCDAGSYWCSDGSIPGPDWMPDSSLKSRPMAIRDRIPDKPPGTDNPGPGTYTLQNDAMRNAQPRFTFKGPATRDFWLPRSAVETPGPGHYKIESPNRLPKWTLGERTLQRAREERAMTALAAGRGMVTAAGRRRASSRPLAQTA
jgi:hypothetical protein